MVGKINWNPNKKEIRNFSLIILVGFGLIGLLVYFRHHIHAAVLIWAIVSGISLLGLIAPKAAKPFYLVWMGFGFVMGSIMSRVVMAIIFYVVLTPVALVFKIMRRDPLMLKKPDAQTYWKDHPKIEDKSYYDHVF